MNISTILNNLIAMVVVLLILSLVVQSIQSGLKKLFRIKSRQIEDSLVDLFEQVMGRKPTRDATFIERSPMLRLLCRGMHPSEIAQKEVKSLYDGVIKEFSNLGRVAQSGNGMLDSLAKDDLLKVLEKVDPNTLAPAFMANLQKVANEVGAVQNAMDSIDPTQLPGDSSAKFAAMQAALAPLLNDFQSIASGATINPKILIGDVISLRELRLDDVVSILGEMQVKLEKDLDAARLARTAADASPTPASSRADASIPVLEKLTTGLNSVAISLSKLRREFDSAIAPLRAKLKEVESWFDTVMQSFDERYARGMKTWAIVISFVVVVLLNANFFSIYQKISSNELVRNNLVESQDRLKELPHAADKANADTVEPAASLVATAKAQEKTVQDETDAYSSFGFNPLSVAQVKNWAYGESSWSVGWGQRLVHMAKILTGWMLMTMLLSVGAPFWEDTLESLFGLKNILRMNSGTKNVEKKSGDGQPKQ